MQTRNDLCRRLSEAHHPDVAARMAQNFEGLSLPRPRRRPFTYAERARRVAGLVLIAVGIATFGHIALGAAAKTARSCQVFSQIEELNHE